MQEIRFTLEHANRTLPLVRRIVEDVVRGHALWLEVMAELDLLAPGVRADRPDSRVEALEREAQSVARELDAFEAELASLGISLKDRRLGLVDFPAEHEGRVVWLCWRLGEPAVQYWHELDGGFAGRQPLHSTRNHP